MKKQILAMALLAVLGFAQTADAFCWYNKSQKAPEVTVWGFYSIDQANTFKKAQGIITTVADKASGLADSNKESTAGQVATQAIPILNKVVDAIATAIAVKFKATLTAESKSCWNFNDILKDAKKQLKGANGQETMYFMIWQSGNEGTAKVIWEGACNIRNGLTLRDGNPGEPEFVVDGQF